MNSGWGKHAQRPIMVQNDILDSENPEHEIKRFELFNNFTKGNFTLKDVVTVSETSHMYKYMTDGDFTSPNLHGGYIPAALFVPAYGRMQLWEELNKLGKRVLMNDTDSIVYIYDPNEYNIPQGYVWGEWEIEDIDSKNGGIRSFVGLGPKTYALKCDNGKTLVKCKGLSLKLSTEEIVNFDTMRKIAIDHLTDTEKYIIKVPQTMFVYRMGQGIHTANVLKKLGFEIDSQKGLVGADYRIYPAGYESSKEPLIQLIF